MNIIRRFKVGDEAGAQPPTEEERRRAATAAEGSAALALDPDTAAPDTESWAEF
jgi:hypothetical protein